MPAAIQRAYAEAKRQQDEESTRAARKQCMRKASADIHVVSQLSELDYGNKNRMELQGFYNLAGILVCP